MDTEMFSEANTFDIKNTSLTKKLVCCNWGKVVFYLPVEEPCPDLSTTLGCGHVLKRHGSIGSRDNLFNGLLASFVRPLAKVIKIKWFNFHTLGKFFASEAALFDVCFKFHDSPCIKMLQFCQPKSLRACYGH